MACNFSDSSKFVLTESKADHYSYCDDKDQGLETKYMGKLTQVIISMDMNLQ